MQNLTTSSVLNTYGIHQNEDKIEYLFQDLCPKGWNFYGIQTPSNLSVKHLRNACSHAINPGLVQREVADKHWEQFLTISRDPLVTAMLPVPNGSTYYLDESQIDDILPWLSCLERLNSPLHTWVKPIWTVRKEKIYAQLTRTNIHPIALTNITVNDAELVTKLIQAAQTGNRTLILVGDSSVVVPKGVKKLTTNLSSLITLSNLIKLPLEHIGASIVGRYCRQEPLFN